MKSGRKIYSSDQPFREQSLNFSFSWKSIKLGIRRLGSCPGYAAAWSPALASDFSLGLFSHLYPEPGQGSPTPTVTSAMSVGRAEAPKPGAFQFAGFDLSLFCITRESLNGGGSSPSMWRMWQGAVSFPIPFGPEDSCGVSTGLPSNPKHPHSPSQFGLKQ